MIHAYMLPLWGMPIGELWDTENLAEKCKKEGTYTFFFTSAPDNVAGTLCQSGFSLHIAPFIQGTCN